MSLVSDDKLLNTNKSKVYSSCLEKTANHISTQIMIDHQEDCTV